MYACLSAGLLVESDQAQQLLHPAGGSRCVSVLGARGRKTEKGARNYNATGLSRLVKMCFGGLDVDHGP